MKYKIWWKKNIKHNKLLGFLETNHSLSCINYVATCHILTLLVIGYIFTNFMSAQGRIYSVTTGCTGHRVQKSIFIGYNHIYVVWTPLTQHEGTPQTTTQPNVAYLASGTPGHFRSGSTTMFAHVSLFNLKQYVVYVMNIVCVLKRSNGQYI